MRRPKIIHKSGKLSRVLEVRSKGRTLSTPTYFPAISSYGIKLSLSYLIYLLANYSYPRILVSAYDIFHSKGKEKEALFSSLKRYDRMSRRNKKGFLFLDSGIYESSWYDDSNWNIDSYRALTSKVKFDFYSNFDVLPKESDKEFMEKTFANIIASRDFTNKGELVVILHGRTPDHLISTVKEFTKAYPDLCDVLAVPERDCGESILERVETIVEVRQMLDGRDSRNLLHILGCGHPLSMLLYSFCGVDFFDSLDWYEHVIDQNALSINDFCQLDLLNCNCKACTFAAGGPYMDRVLLHNLLFYQEFMKKIQSLIRNDGILSFLNEHIDRSIFEKIKKF